MSKVPHVHPRTLTLTPQISTGLSWVESSAPPEASPPPIPWNPSTCRGEASSVPSGPSCVVDISEFRVQGLVFGVSGFRV